MDILINVFWVPVVSFMLVPECKKTFRRLGGHTWWLKIPVMSEPTIHRLLDRIKHLRSAINWIVE